MGERSARTKAPGLVAPEAVQLGPVMRDSGLSMVPVSQEITVGSVKVDAQLGRVVLGYEDDNLGRCSAVVGMKDAVENTRMRLAPPRYLCCDYCKGTGVAWCPHVLAVVKEGLDRGLLGPGRYVVPLVPTDGIFFRVTVLPPEEALGAPSALPFPAPAQLNEVSVAMMDRAKATKADFVVGYLDAAGGTMMQVRRMVIDWLQGQLDNELHFRSEGCRNPLHERVVSSADIVTTPLGRRFYPALTGVCLACSEEIHRGEKYSPDEDAPVF